MNLLHINKVSKAYHYPILKGVNLEIDKGDIICLLGKSGSGKSTLLNCIMGIETVDSGTIQVNEKVAYMQQKDLLLPHQTVLENVILAKRLAKQPIAFDKAKQLLEDFGLTDVEQVYSSDLSGGMRQRVAFARTIFSDRKLLLLDEPFAALDALTRLNMQAWFNHVAQQYELTALWVTHDIDEALHIAKRIAILKDGKLSVIKQLSMNKADYINSKQYLIDKAEVLKALM